MWHLILVSRNRGHYVATFVSIDAALNYIAHEFL
jgi:hypothetical protein